MKRLVFALLPVVLFFSALVDAQTALFTWVGGENSINSSGVYGTKGAADAGNVPGARNSSVSWTDANGDLWLFGGYGHNNTSNWGRLNDLWKYESSTGEWTWISGDSTINSIGIYGTKGVAGAANIPGARTAGVSWTDGNGNLWMFGGFGRDGAGSYGLLNDLWKYDPSTGQWMWISGTNLTNSIGVYGMKGTADATNIPGARASSVSWMDAEGALWLFGGNGYDRGGISGWLNDLWKYDISTGEWTWISGSSTADNIGVYGTKGVADEANNPGARIGSVSWMDGSGILWLFGGEGRDSAGSWGYLNDLWSYDLSMSEWTWVSGSNTVNSIGIYGTKGEAAKANVPGACSDSISWTNKAGDLCLFGGGGYDSTGSWGYLNGLWKYDISRGEWTWVSGGSMRNESGIYGTKGVAESATIPGARPSSISWTDETGVLWLFGGYGYGSAGSVGQLNDLWKVELITETVDFDELAVLAAHWMETECSGGTDCAEADWFVDGTIDLLDLQELASWWLGGK